MGKINNEMCNEMRNLKAIVISMFLLFNVDIVAQCDQTVEIDSTLLRKAMLNWLNNDSIRFHIGLTNHMSQYRIGVILKNDSDLFIIQKIGNKQWLNLLNDSRYDWASNLCLYSLYDRDAINIGHLITDREKWIRYNQYQEDIQYWKMLFEIKE